MDTTSLVRQAYAPNLPPLARGYIVPTRAAPTTFTEGVFVVLPEGSTEHLYGPCKWGAIHGTTKPQPGEACVVAFDEQNQPTIVWWEGKQTEPTTAEAWKLASALGFKNEWENFEAGARRAEYRKNPLGTVELRGILKGGKEGLEAFKLPEGYRPKEEKAFVVDANTLTGFVFVFSTGEVRPQKGTGETKVFCYLDSVSFSVE